MASPDDDDPPHDDPVPPAGVGVDDMLELIHANLLEDHVFFDDDDAPTGDDLDEAFWIAGRGHLESIDFYDASEDGGGADEGGSGEAGEADAGAADPGEADGAEPPLFEFGTNDIWGAAATTDDPTEDAGDVSADAPKAEPSPNDGSGSSGDGGAGT